MVDFKNFKNLKVRFDSDFVGITGENGEGKTNILDAIYYLCTTKSYFNAAEKYNFRFGTGGMALWGDALKSEEEYRIGIKAVSGQRKEISVNQVKEEKTAEYVGKFPVIMIAPDDNMIVLGGSAERRRMIDIVMCQSDTHYTGLLIQYNKILANRNALLRQIAENPGSQLELLDTVDLMLSNSAEQIFLRRKVFMERFSKEFGKMYSFISESKERTEIEYKSHLHETENLYQLLVKNRQRDILTQRTTKGVHLDDLELMLNDHSVRKVGSQGQQKTFVVSMKLALYTILSEDKKIMPILLLDDIFDKFDHIRIRQLFSILSEIRVGQVFVTDTQSDRIREALKLTEQKFEVFHIDKGHVKKEKN